jgi:DNA-binding response OmpR family regulator
MNKIIKKCKDMHLIAISYDELLLKTINETFKDVKGLTTTNSNKKALELAKTIDFDIVIINARDDDFEVVLNDIGELNTDPLKIVILNTNNENNILKAINCNVYTVLIKPFNVKNLKLSILMSLNQSKKYDQIILGDGFYFDIYRDRVYNKNNFVVELTKLELSLLKFILNNKGKVVDYDTIHKKVWKNKNMSIFTMRNVVNKLRVKLHYNIFENASSQGYILK